MPNGYNTIVIKGVGEEDIENYEEGEAGGAILAGDIIKLHTDGTYIRNAEADVSVECLIATENCLSFSGKSIDEAYASGDRVSFVRVPTGMEVQVRVIASQNYDTGSYFTPNNAGKFKEVASTEFRMFKCLEADDVSVADDLVLVRKV